MNTTRDVADDARPYVEAVTERIAGLPDERRTELLDDLTQHLTELAAEAEVPLADRLGSPAVFADEYLSSAGIEPILAQPHRGGVREAIARGWRELADHPTVAAVRGFLPELRPAWWAARGYLLVAAWPALSNRAALPFPDVDLPGHKVTGTALGLVAAALSVRLARRTAEGRFHRSAFVANVLGVGAALVVAAADAPPDEYVTAADGLYMDASVPAGYVVSAEGNPITNLFVYDAEGNLLEGVYVFDQDGRPVSTPATIDPDLQTTVPLDADGDLVVNQYPQREERVFFNADGTTELVREPAPVPNIPALPEPPATTSTTIVPGSGGVVVPAEDGS